MYEGGAIVHNAAEGGSLRAGFILICLAITGCASARVPVALRTEADARPVEGETRIFLLSETSVPMGARGFGQFTGDSFVVYRPVEQQGGASAYRRDVYRVGRSGIQVGGYTLTDGRHLRFNGTVRREGDRLVFHRIQSARSMEKVEPTTEVSLAMSEVRAVDALLPDAGKTVIMISGVMLIILTALGLAFKSAMSEPLF